MIKSVSIDSVINAHMVKVHNIATLLEVSVALESEFTLVIYFHEKMKATDVSI